MFLQRLLIPATLLVAISLSGCGEKVQPEEPVDDGPDVTAKAPDQGIHTKKAPLYWTVYEYLWTQEAAGISSSRMDITSEHWDKIIDWMATNFLPYGYDMVCTDGFVPTYCEDGSMYLNKYGSCRFEEIIAKCKARGLKLGVYDNPLWIHCPSETVIPGTSYTVGSLKYDSSKDKVTNPSAADRSFSWAVATHPGCKEFIDGFFKHYHDLGVDFIRMDFMSWYEDGHDNGMGTVGRGYGRDVYELALKYICESAQKYGIFLSIVMPHLFNDAEFEKEYGHMFRIVRDTWSGGWDHFSEASRGKVRGVWPNCDNQFDGFIHWSKVAGRGSVIMDGDFTRLNTFKNEEQKKSVISLQLLAGGPIAIADQYNTIGDNARFYQNAELLALNKDRFAGRPLSKSIFDKKSQIWYGQMKNGDWVVGLFNRSASLTNFSLKFSELGLDGLYKVRDLWTHQDEGSADGVDVDLKAYDCKIIRLSR